MEVLLLPKLLRGTEDFVSKWFTYTIMSKKMSKTSTLSSGLQTLIVASIFEIKS